MASKTQYCWIKIQDISATWGVPLVGAVAVATGPFLLFDFDAAQQKSEYWAGFYWLTSYLVPIAFWLSVLLSVLGTIIANKQKKTIKSLNDQVRQQERQVAEIGNVIVILCDGLLLNLATKLKLAQISQARLSLYVHHSESKTFIPCGRYSPNPNFNRKGRTAYPDHQGCVAHGWNNVWHFDNQFPAASQAKARRDYNLKNYGVPEEITDAIGMKSTLYAVRRLDSVEGKAIAVLVVEAMNSDAFGEIELKTMINGSVSDYARVIHELRAYVPNPIKAEESGL